MVNPYGTKGTLLAIVAMFGTIAAFVLLAGVWGMRCADGSFEGAFVQGDALFVGERYDLPAGGWGSAGGRRLTKIALDTGEELGRIAFHGGGELRCAAAEGARAFCVAGTVCAIDTNALEELEEPSATPSDREIAWPFAWAGSLPEARDDLVDARRLTVDAEPTWLVHHAATASGGDGRLLRVDRRGELAQVPLEEPFEAVRTILPHQGDLVLVVSADDATDVLRVTTSGEVRWRVTL